MDNQTKQEAGNYATQIGRDVHGGINVVTSGLQTAMYLIVLVAIISIVSMFGIFGLVVLPTSAQPTLTPTAIATSTPKELNITEITPNNTPTTLPTNTPIAPTSTPELTSTPTEMPTPIVSAKSSLNPTCSRTISNVFIVTWQEFGQVLGCPINDQITIPLMAEETFQGGYLFWRSDTNDVYVIYDRQKENGSLLWEGKWITDPTWDWAAVGEPDPDGIGLSPPPRLVEPKRGFGWLWRNFLGRENGQLGWALAKEQGFENTGLAQNFENGIIFKGSSSKVYLLLNNGRFWAR